MRGGYYPAAMGSILRSGPVFVSSAIFAALRLINGSKERMKSRKTGGRGHGTRKVKRTKT
uniref:Uncharacterized protein n=1 Tax=viral metagenome TaxID=1070528 RepID=A0A6C0JXD1_9ZZZZ